ncbi:SRPBCC family protein [Burkholderia multivorans]|uniref:Activator of Hsp90 ATPase 1 family protein n=1 Tax=Burkholderia multivorans CGD2 TaxID=513052 RepID=B9BUJ8_9BURK|nr:SRPBCC family protein [Burkholderia multivorans]EEE05495.1 activator of Hsp90 ATPase 1 family protein [Burkholderia multivorans CGD2]EEE11767.1 activator of Hsp90 ATPase 1 family protein [Burkholderia multivorans CGD2M]
MMHSHTTHISRHVNAPRNRVYRALLDPHAVEQWKVPDGMTCHVHAFDAREGGALRVSLTSDAAVPAGKTDAHTDTYHGRFVTLVPDRQVVEIDVFETDDPMLRGAMTITITLSDEDGGTRVDAVHDGVPPGVPASDNETGWRMALARLAALVEDGGRPHA